MNIILVPINAKFIHSSLAAYSLYSYLHNCLGDEIETVVIKEFTINHSEDLIISELFNIQPDMLAFSCYIWNIEMVLSIVQTFKKILPNVKIVLGGPEVSYEYDYLFAYGVDAIVPGEGEQAFKSLVEDFLNNKPLQQIYKSVEGISLVDIPFPYMDPAFSNFNNRILYYETTRGCVNNCGFCLSSATKGVRFLSMDRVKADLAIFLAAKVKQVKFVDRTFNCNKQHTMDIWSYLIQNDNGITNFHFEIAGDLLDAEMINLLRQAGKGLFQFEIGVQSTNPKTLAAINRRTDTSKLLENVRTLKLLGNIHCHLDLIVGLPYEDEHSFIGSFNDVISCFPDKLQVGFLKLLKGSNLHKDSEKYEIQSKDSPPYEILSNKFMGFDIVNRLKKVEHMVDTFYNSDGFKCYVQFMLRHFKTPYNFFDALSVYWEENGYHLVSHKRLILYTILYEFGKDIALSNTMEISELLKFDMLLQENLRTFPEWIAEYYHYDHKQITRTTGIHTFNYDIFTWLKETDAPLQKKQIKLLFDYEKRKDTGYCMIEKS
ncbi:MAG: B12-binding domain-containing radical SAM protein [Defluviitaleaceae bacterium]|nr:B12-binding domain-containing radical SAM protein [Defluviitaleaceae bacterium]